MDAFFERLIVGAATIDELLSENFEPRPGPQSDANLAAQRLTAWCAASAGGDQALFARRLQRDGIDPQRARALFSSARPARQRSGTAYGQAYPTTASARWG